MMSSIDQGHHLLPVNKMLGGGRWNGRSRIKGKKGVSPTPNSGSFIRINERFTLLWAGRDSCV